MYVGKDVCESIEKYEPAETVSRTRGGRGDVAVHTKKAERDVSVFERKRLLFPYKMYSERKKSKSHVA